MAKAKALKMKKEEVPDNMELPNHESILKMICTQLTVVHGTFINLNETKSIAYV
jgi:hypothetical protein